MASEIVSITVSVKRRKVLHFGESPFVAVVGGGRCSPEEGKLAEEVGTELARRGAVLVCGGLGGVMEAAARGARSKGGLTVGILPGDSREAANIHICIPIATALGEARNMLVVRASQAVIAIGGEYGTLSEIAFALKLGIPVVGLDIWSLSKKGKSLWEVIPARTAVEAVEKAFKTIINPKR